LYEEKKSGLLEAGATTEHANAIVSTKGVVMLPLQVYAHTAIFSGLRTMNMFIMNNLTSVSDL
jgi:hypothetical protein